MSNSLMKPDDFFKDAHKLLVEAVIDTVPQESGVKNHDQAWDWFRNAWNKEFEHSKRHIVFGE